MSQPEVEKQKLREKYLEIRKSIPEDKRKEYSNKIKNHLKGFEPLKKATVIHCYMSMNEKGEVQTSGIIQWLMANSKTIGVPKADLSTNEMTHYVLQNPDEWIENEWGIREPIGGKEIQPAQFDLVIVPMVAADKNKNRLGYGKGFYDRFLSKTEALKVGLTYQACLMEKPMPVEEFDIKMDHIVSEDGIL